MSSITSQQTKLDLELVPKENRLDIRKCNGRIPRGLTPRELTFQVVLDAIALTTCYPAFLITADVPEVYMHQFWNSVYKHDTSTDSRLTRRNNSNLPCKSSEISFRFAQEYQNRKPLSEDLLGATTQRDTGSYYPKRYWELLPKEILGAIPQRDTQSYYQKRDLLWARKISKRGGRVWRGHDCQRVTRRCLEALELKGGDGGACKLLGWLLGDVMVMQRRCLRCLVA
ncbi:hypothetical protein Tco_1257491 [Tanacetum coccineum]